MLHRRCLAGALLFSICAAAYSQSLTAPDQVAGLEAGQINDPGEALKLTVAVSAGGQYVTKAGLPIKLRGRYVVAGHTQNTNRLTAIGQALQGYLRDHGSYPPAALLNAEGRRTVSWRVLILPYLGHKALYDRFDLTKPWDDPVNLYLLRRMPAVYRKSGADQDSTETGFAGVEGVNSLFENASADLNGGRPLSGISVTQKIAVGPVGAGVHLPWTAPGDIHIGSVSQLGSPGGFSGEGSAFTPLLFLDGTVYLIPNNIAPGSMIWWTQVSGFVGCPCAVPSSVDAGLRARWDFGSTGTANPQGWEVTFVAPQPGTYPVTMRVADHFGNEYSSSAIVSVR